MYLTLDSSIRNWVFFPLTIITVCINLLMKYLNIKINLSEPKANPSSLSEKEFNFKEELTNRDQEIKIKNGLNRANKLKANYMFISEKGFKQRKAFFCRENEGFFTQKVEAKEANVMNPNMMGDMLKKNLLNGLYYILVFVGVGYFFSGFILLKLPFGLSQKFRSMLQQGLNLPELDLSYVSAVSWCFILVFGLNSILQHIDGGDFSMMQEQEKMLKQPLMPFSGPQVDYTKILTSEKENIEILPSFSLLDDAVDNVLSKYESKH